MIEVRDLAFAYRTAAGETPVLRGVSFRVERGEMVAIQGPSGSGKSTLLYFLGCLLRPDRGSVKFEGTELTELSDGERALFRNRRLGFVFQQFHLLPRATVVDNILLATRYPAECRRRDPEARARAEALAREVGLGDRLHHLPNQLSGGQQQRVAIARALMNDPDLILADEPTGNLDSRHSAEILSLFESLNRKGKTILLITHDAEVAARCGRVLRIADGELREETPAGRPRATDLHPVERMPRGTWPSLVRASLPVVWESLGRNRGRSLLTMSGVTIGVCAVLAMVTLGQFTKRKILDSYAELGVNTILIRGHHNWNLKATDDVTVSFRGFHPQRDIAPLPRIFPELEVLSPVLDEWGYAVMFGGKRVDSDVRVLGVTPEAFAISNRLPQLGTVFRDIHVEDKSPVCLIGSEIRDLLFRGINPIGQVVRLSRDQTSYGCRVLGVLRAAESPKEWRKPNLEVYVPYTFFQAVANPWSAQIRTLLLQVRHGTDAEATGRALRAFFEQKYGKAGEFRVSSDTVLIAQMKRFLTLFTVLLGAIALVSLGVGGIGITNMMLVSLSERLKEIGLRKALGATDRSLRVQLLLEAVALCAVAGLAGIVLGILVYQGVIYGATLVMPKLVFEWVFEPVAMALAFFSLLAVGIGSGLLPALRAERLQVIEALRAE